KTVMENQEVVQEGEQLPPAMENQEQPVQVEPEPDTQAETAEDLKPDPEKQEESVDVKLVEPEPGQVSELEPEQVPVAVAEEVPELKEEEKQSEQKSEEGKSDEEKKPEPEKVQEEQVDVQKKDQEAGSKGEQESQEQQKEEVKSKEPSESGMVSEPEKEEESKSGEGGTQKEEQAPEPATSPSVAPGSMSFAFLEQEETVAFIRTSQTIFILRGLPGSGKSQLARAISDTYQDLCTIISGDDHGIKPEKYAASTEGFKALDSAVADCCSSGKVAVVVVDDVNHVHGRLVRLGELAEENQYVPLYVEPRTEWSRNVQQLAQKTPRGLNKGQIQALVSPMVETSLPFYFGWFFSRAQQEKLRNMANEFLTVVGSLEAFKNRLSDFTGEAEKEVDLQQYFIDKGVLHCTTKFCDYGKAKGAKEYAEKQAVRESYGCKSDLALTALFLTPRTLGAQVSLTQAQLLLWPEDAEKEAGLSVDLPPGSRAHVTVGCAEGVEALQTGLDLLEIIVQRQQGEKGEHIQDLELGPLTYYGKGVWMMTLHEPFHAPVLFSSFYGPKKEEEGKEPEKKKKHKCSLIGRWAVPGWLAASLRTLFRANGRTGSGPATSRLSQSKSGKQCGTEQCNTPLQDRTPLLTQV
ncbi:tetratricopeptide repeat protein 25, partial [Arapaima gigas]